MLGNLKDSEIEPDPGTAEPIPLWSLSYIVPELMMEVGLLRELVLELQSDLGRTKDRLSALESLTRKS